MQKRNVKMALNQNKYKPSICSIDEVDDRNLKANCENDLKKQQQNQHLEGSETAPLTTNQQKLNIDDNLERKDLESPLSVDGTAGLQHSGTPSAGGNGAINGLRGRVSFDALMRLSRKRRILYIATACLGALLLVVIILLIAFWPNVPFYLRAEVCLDKECVLASQQILLWSNTSRNPCHETYDWACGKFQQEYEDNEYFVIKRGEWDYQTYNEYQELNELNRFISMLPSPGVSYSVESMISSLYRSCREIDTLDKSQSDLLLKKAIKSVDGWQAFPDSNRLQNWDNRKALVHLQAVYGIFPYYKVSIENRYNKPHDYIIALDEGEIGLPDKYFYNIDQNDEIIRAYKLLLRDFAINIGIVSREAEMFADEIFHYEIRIVSHINSVQEVSEDHKKNRIQTLAELKNIAPNLPILESLQAIFPHTKITDHTEVLVRNIDVLNELSTVISTSDKKPINNFIVWSLARHLLPHLSKEYRNLIENFDRAVYGRTATYPRWMICSKIVRDWLPFAVDALQQKPHLIQSSSHLAQTSTQRLKKQHFPNKTLGNDEFLRLMYYSIRNQLQDSVEKADWLPHHFKDFVSKKLTSMRLQIGVPEEALHNSVYIKNYYNELLLNNLFFVEHLESIWSFQKTRMEEKLKALNVVDTIISEMYTQAEPKPLAYSNILNMLIVSRSITYTKYYDYKYPVAVNFARIGADIAEILIDVLATFAEQFKEETLSLGIQSEKFNLANLDVACITADEEHREDLQELAENALKSFQITLSAAKISAKALSSFISSVDNESPIIGASVDENLSYEQLHLTQRHRLPGLRSYNENELFTLAYMQKHCSAPIADKDYARIKPHVEKKLAERYLFNATWNHIQFLSRSSSCSVPDVRCPNIL